MPAKTDRGRKKSQQLAAIIGSLSVVAIILSPISPLDQFGNSASNSPGTLVDNPQPDDISDESVLECTSVFQGVEYVIAGGRVQPIPEEFPEGTEEPTRFNLTSREQLASDTLLDEFCNRPELVQNMSASYDPTVNLVAYGCEASSENIGDSAMQESIADYQDIYCPSAFETVEFEVGSWADSIGIFKAEVIPEAREQVGNNATAIALLDEAESTVNNASDSVIRAQDLLDSGLVYDAANALDEGITKFTALIEREEMAAVLGL